MAAVYDTDIREYEGEDRQETPPANEAPSLQAILAADNVAGLLTETRLNLIGALCHEEFELDKRSKSEWDDRNERGFNLAMQVATNKTYPFDKASNVTYPMIVVAAMQFHARAYPAIIPDRMIVKGVVNGNDKGVPQTDPQGQPVMQTGPDGKQEPVWRLAPGEKQKKAQRIARHMSWQLLEEEENWEPDTDVMLHYLPIAGCCFRKRWFDLTQQKICSRWLPATELVVNYHARSMDDAPRASEMFTRLPYQVVELMRSGAWKECDLEHLKSSADEQSDPDKGQDTQDEDSPIAFIEQHRRLDLDGDGYAEPYVVTFVQGTGGKIVRIEKAFGQNEIKFSPDNKIARIVADSIYTKYDFIPNPRGGFYGIGFGWLLTPINEAVNTTINQLFDAGHLANTPMGFIGQGLRLKTGSMRFAPGEWKTVSATGTNLRENLFQLQFPGPSETLFKLLGLLIESANDISAVKDILLGKMDKNIAPTTALTLVEQGSKQFTAIFKRFHRSLKRELKQLFRLNADYMSPQKYFVLLDEPEAVGKEDYNTDELDVSPISDPNMVTDAVRMAKAEALMVYRGDPGVNQTELRRRCFEAIGIPEPEKLLVKNPPPDPKVLNDEGRLDNDRMRVKTAAILAEAQITELRARAVKHLADAEAAEVGAQMDQYLAQVKAISAETDSAA